MTWQPVALLTLGTVRTAGYTLGGRWHLTVSPMQIEVLNEHGVRQQVTYQPRGDYEDRWVNRAGRPVTFERWRPIPR